MASVSAPASSLGGRTYQVPAAQLVFSLPDSWKPVNARSVLTDKNLGALIRANPSYASLLAQLAQPTSPMKFFALDPYVRQGFATNANVTVAPLPHPMTQEAYLRALVAAYAGFEIRNQNFALVRLPGGTAVRATFQLPFNTASEKKWVSTRQYSFMHGTAAVTVTYTTLPAFERQYRPSFLASARSIRFTS
jgi:hypothetical protein